MQTDTFAAWSIDWLLFNKLKWHKRSKLYLHDILDCTQMCLFDSLFYVLTVVWHCILLCQEFSVGLVISFWDKLECMKYGMATSHPGFVSYREEVFQVEWDPNHETVLASSADDRRLMVWDLNRYWTSGLAVRNVLSFISFFFSF